MIMITYYVKFTKGCECSSSFTHNSPKLETAQMSSHRMDKLMMVHEKAQTQTGSNTKASQLLY